jgi:DNA-binding beta-propeller fold protein YncE
MPVRYSLLAAAFGWVPAAATMAYVTNERDNSMCVIDDGQRNPVNTIALGRLARVIVAAPQ